MSNPKHWMQTYTTRAFRFDDPTSLDIVIQDIARPLSRIPRFCGHTNFALSVAEHSVVVSRIVKQLDGDELTQLHALMHDAHEAFTGDIPTPLKNYMREVHGFDISQVQAVINTNILAALGVPELHGFEQVEKILAADRYALKIERDKFMESSLDWGDTDTIRYAESWAELYGKNVLCAADAMKDFIARYKFLMRAVEND